VARLKFIAFNHAIHWATTTENNGIRGWTLALKYRLFFTKLTSKLTGLLHGNRGILLSLLDGNGTGHLYPRASHKDF